MGGIDVEEAGAAIRAAERSVMGGMGRGGATA
jgi:hypothetical protein